MICFFGKYLSIANIIMCVLQMRQFVTDIIILLCCWIGRLLGWLAFPFEPARSSNAAAGKHAVHDGPNITFFLC